MTDRIPLKDGLFTLPDDLRTARLLAGQCGQCARVSFPAQTTCPYCSADGCVTVPLSPLGVVEVCTTVTNRPPGYEGPLPFGFGVVELPEGIRIITRINHPEQVLPGTPVQLIIAPLFVDADGHEVLAYAFQPVITQPSTLTTQN